METYSAGLSTDTQQLIHYTDLFKGSAKDGNRILIKGEPGSGKTTFIHKVAFDWATGNLNQFDTVFVVKLKFASMNQSVENMIKSQICTISESTSDSLIGKYLESGKDRVLLVLDGLDEIKLENFPQLQEILNGRAFRKCHILVTSRPTVIESIQKNMRVLAKITGFSRIKAKEYTSTILNEAEGREFFRQLEARNMSQMYRIPLILQLLALLYKVYKTLPDTLTGLYDQLIIFLIKSHKDYKSLTEEEIQAAISNEVPDDGNVQPMTDAEIKDALGRIHQLNADERQRLVRALQNEIQEAMAELGRVAFQGFQKEEQQLVFSRKQILNQKIHKLGVITEEKSGSGFRPTTVLQFLHKTLQEHALAKHVALRLKSHNRKSWNRLKTLLFPAFEKEAEPDNQRTSRYVSSNQKEEHNKTHRDTFRSALRKFKAVFSHKEHVLEIFRAVYENGGFDEDADLGVLWEVFRGHDLKSFLQLEEEETRVLFDFLIRDAVQATGQQERAAIKTWVKVRLDGRDIREFCLGALAFFNMAESQPETAQQYLKYVMTLGDRHDVPYMYSEYFNHWQAVNSTSILLKFLVGQIPEEFLNQILIEIADQLVKSSCNPYNGDVLPFQDVQSSMADFIRERRGDQATDALRDAWITSGLIQTVPPLFQYGDTHSTSSGDIPATQQDLISHTALKIHGSGRELEFEEDGLQKKLKNLNTCHIAELEDLSFSRQDNQDFVNALFQSPIAALQLTSLDSHLVSTILKNLPQSMVKLAIYGCAPSTYFKMPATLNLVYLYLETENCGLNIQTLFSAQYPELKRLHVVHAYTWSQPEVEVLAEAVKEGGMPKLESLAIRSGKLQGCGQNIADLVRNSPSLRSLDLLNCDLNEDDGREILSSIRAGEFSHICDLVLLDNPNLCCSEELKAECEMRDIVFLVDPAPAAQPMGIQIASGLLNTRSERTTCDIFSQIFVGFAQFLQAGSSVHDIGDMLSRLIEPVLPALGIPSSTQGQETQIARARARENGGAAAEAPPVMEQVGRALLDITGNLVANLFAPQDTRRDTRGQQDRPALEPGANARQRYNSPDLD